MNKTAVLLYGFMRTFKTTAPSLLEKVVRPNDADIFIFSYKNEGVSVLPKNCDINKTKKNHAQQQDLEGDIVNEDILKSVYGKSLKYCSIQTYSDFNEKFKMDTSGIYSPIIPIERVYSLYFNITGVTKLLSQYEKETGIKYDNVILARPDLLFYSKINLDNYDLNKLNIASYGGNIKTCEKNQPYYVCYYKNVERMEYIPFNEVVFSDQLIISSRKNFDKLIILYDSLSAYNEYCLPVCHPETILYYHLAYSENLDVCLHDIKYEILRNNYTTKENEIVCNIPVINKKDKYKNKFLEDIKNILCGLKSVFSFFINLIKYLTWR